MMDIINQALENSVWLLFSIISLGILVGRIPVFGIRIGGSGVLLVGLLFGHWGYLLPKSIQTLGVVFFVYTIGLKAGPYIVESLKKSKGTFLILALIITSSAGGLTLAFKTLFNLPADLLAGIYAGAMTSTPALAAAMEAIESNTPSVGYGLAYPLGILGVILFVQVLPNLLKINLKNEEESYRAGSHVENLERSSFYVTNPNVVGRPISDIFGFSKGMFRIVRLKRAERIFPVQSDTVLELKDMVLVVAKPNVLDDLTVLLGERLKESIPESDEAQSRWLVISSKKLLGRNIGQLEIGPLYGVVISRVKRAEVEFMPHTNFVFEAGDEIRVSGLPADIDRFANIVGRDRETLHETDIFSFTFGLALAVLVGLIKIPLGGGVTLGLGIAGGPLIVGLLLGYFGRFGQIMGYMPKAAHFIVGELGLYLFLASAGTSAGEHFLSVFKESGWLLIVCGAAITTLPILLSAFVARYFLGMNFLTTLGMICGGMTSTPALAVISSQTKSDIPALGYTAIYPLAVLLTTIFAQVIVLF